jgi:hypothetical protein
MILAFACAAAAAAYAQDFEHGSLVGGAFGATSYETFDVYERELQRSYKVGFHFDADFMRNDGFVTHVVTFDYSAIEAQDIFDRKYGGEIAFNYNLEVFFTGGPLRPAARPFFGGRFATGDRGVSQGELGILGGLRFVPSPKKCVFSDVFFGWLGRYGSLPHEWATEYWGWKSYLALRNANTIEIVPPLCVYVTAALDYGLYDVSRPDPRAERENPKPVFYGGVGPAFFF